MTNLKRSLAVLLIVASAACATQSAQKTTYDVLGIASVAVDTGMKIFADRVVAGTVPQALQDTVRKDYGIYQAAMATAHAAVNAWLALGATAPPALFPTGQVGAALTAAAAVQAEVK
jgi:hypothetical protein